jgi:hypothetical protein
MNERIKELLSHPSTIPAHAWMKLSPLIKSDKLYLGILYFLMRRKIMHWKHPKRFNEKLQWLKINYDNPKRIPLVDKYEVKRIVKDVIGEQYIIPTYGVWEKFEDIDFEQLPNQFVLKCTHDSGGIVICTDKEKFDKEKARKKINHHLKRNYYWGNREYEYQFVKPRILAEKYMVDESGWQLKDYKVFCFNGEPKFIEVDYDRYVGHKLNVYDLNWEYVDFYMTSPNDPNVNIPRPDRLGEMLELCKKLAQNEAFVRVDFYSIGDELYFGELTFYPGAGCIDFHPDKYDIILGNLLVLPNKASI